MIIINIRAPVVAKKCPIITSSDTTSVSHVSTFTNGECTMYIVHCTWAVMHI